MQLIDVLQKAELNWISGRLIMPVEIKDCDGGIGNIYG
jgi:hypothetical protein